MHNTLVLLTRSSRCAWLHKDLNNSLRLKNVSAIFPQARFIYIKRHPLYTAQSLLLARRQLYGDIRHWFGSRPPPRASNEMPADPFEQVVWQVKTINAIIESFQASSSLSDFARLGYDSGY